MSSRNTSIRSWLAGLVMACVVPAVLGSALLAYYIYQREYAQIEQGSIDTARAMVLAVDRELATGHATLQTLATSHHLTTGDLAAFYRQAKEVLPIQNSYNIVLSNPAGHQLLNTLRPFGEDMSRYGNPPALQHAVETGGTAVSDFFVGPVAGRPLIGIEVSVKRNGKVIYGLGLGMLPERFGHILLDQRLPPDTVVSIFDSTGTVVARSHHIEQFLGKKGAPALVEKMAQVREGSLETDTLEGVSVLAAFSRSTVSNWTVAIGVPKANLIGELWRSLWIIVLGALGLLIAGLMMAWLFGGEIARAMRVLANQALALGYGKPVDMPQLILKEANDAGMAIAKASELIEMRTAERDRAAEAERRMMIAKQQAEYDARHDPLTGLPNRMLFAEIVEQRIVVCQHQDTGFALLYIDLDGFKEVNDRHGHDTGDNLLRMVAARLRTSIRHSDVATRFGGDEFVVLLADSDFPHASQIALKLIEELSLPYSIDGMQLRISASIGVACYPETALTTDELLRLADHAMYKAKMSGKHRYAVAG